jgi:hybrid cluster-associated redox disulfide protein
MQHYSADTLISDVLTSDPRAVGVFNSFGLGCSSCLAAGMETLASVASMHDVPVEQLLAALEAMPRAHDEGAEGD